MEFLTTNSWWLLTLITIICIFAYKKLTNNRDALTSKFEARKTLYGDTIDIVKFIEKALNHAGFKKVGHNTDENRFYAQTRFSMSSFSEYIEVLYSSGNLATDLKFKSICALPTQVFDWGKNLRNYKRFEKELEKLLPTRSNSIKG
ncbi:MAG: hypothetical protein NTV75_03140 [Bacteroidia bacterium]|nr:hypothetical protein [Bacteroidia bacterium]